MESNSSPFCSAWICRDGQGRKGGGHSLIREADFGFTSPFQHPTGHLGKKLHPGSAWVIFLSFQGQDFLQRDLMFPELAPSAPTMLNKCICFLQILGRALNQSYMEMRRSGMPLCNPMVSHPDRAQLQVICSPLNHIF